MTDQLTYKALKDAVGGTAAAFRCRLALQPAGGPGGKVFPPTYAGAAYATEKRRVPDRDEPVECVLLDSVQSQANRMEEALQQALDDKRIVLPVVEVNFEPYFPGNSQPEDMRLLEPVGKISTLQAPHRIADAILRDSLLDGTAFRESATGKILDRVSVRNATPLLELCPTALLFGMWDSTGPKGGLGVKFERAMVGEVVGIDAVYGVKTSSRLDPLGIRREAGPLYRRINGGWTLDPNEAVDELSNGKPTGKKILYKKNDKGKDVAHKPGDEKYADQGRPSVANLGNVTPSFGKYTKGVEGRDPLLDHGANFRYEGHHGGVDADDAFSFSASIRERDTDARQGQIAPGGVTISHAEQTIVLSLPALRRLRFPVKDEYKSDYDVAGRTVVAALGLLAAVLADEAGLDLRSRCLLYSDADPKWEILGRSGGGTFTLAVQDAIGVFNDAVKTAKGLGLPWREKPVELSPSPQLVKLVVKSQRLAETQGGTDEDAAD